MWVFHFFDENNNGTIGIENITNILRGCNRKIDSTEISALFSDMDKNSDGKIDINEFTAACRRNDVLLRSVGLY